MAFDKKDFLYYIEIGPSTYGVVGETEYFVKYMDIDGKGKVFSTPKDNLQRRIEKEEVELTKNR